VERGGGGLEGGGVKEQRMRRSVWVCEVNCEDTGYGAPHLDATDIVGILGEQILHQL